MGLDRAPASAGEETEMKTVRSALGLLADLALLAAPARTPAHEKPRAEQSAHAVGDRLPLTKVGGR